MTPQQIVNELVVGNPVALEFSFKSDAVNFRNLVATTYHRKLDDYIKCELLSKSDPPSLLSTIEQLSEFQVKLTLRLGKKERKHGGPISFQILTS